MNQEVVQASDLIPSMGHEESIRSIYFDARSQGQQSSSLGLSSRIPSLDGMSFDSGSEQDASSVDTEIVADKSNEDSLSGAKIDTPRQGSPSAETCEEQKAAEKAIAALSFGRNDFPDGTSGGGETCQIQTSDVCRPTSDAELVADEPSHQSQNTNDAQTVLPKIDVAKKHSEYYQDDPSDVRSTLYVIPPTANRPQNHDKAHVTQNCVTKMQDCSSCEQYQSKIDALLGELECAQRMIQSLVSENSLLGDEIAHLNHCADEERRRMEVDRTQAIASLIAENQFLRSLFDETKQARQHQMRTEYGHEENRNLKGKPQEQVRWKRPPPLGITDGGTITLDSESQCVGYSPLSAGRLLQS